MRLLICFLSAMFVWSCLQVELVAQQQTDLQSAAILALERAFLPNHSVRLKLQSVTYRKKGDQQKEVQIGSLDADLMRDGDKWWICGKRAATRLEEDGPKEYKGEFEHLLSDDQRADITWHDTKKNDPNIFAATFDRSAVADRSRVVSLCGPFLFGFSCSNFNQSLAQELAAAQSQGRLTLKQLGLETLLQARDVQGELSITLVRQNDLHVPVRIRASAHK